MPRRETRCRLQAGSFPDALKPQTTKQLAGTAKHVFILSIKYFKIIRKSWIWPLKTVFSCTPSPSVIRNLSFHIPIEEYISLSPLKYPSTCINKRLPRLLLLHSNKDPLFYRSLSLSSSFHRCFIPIVSSSIKSIIYKLQQVRKPQSQEEHFEETKVRIYIAAIKVPN